MNNYVQNGTKVELKPIKATKEKGNLSNSNETTRIFPIEVYGKNLNLKKLDKIFHLGK